MIPYVRRTVLVKFRQFRHLIYAGLFLMTVITGPILHHLGVLRSTTGIRGAQMVMLALLLPLVVLLDVLLGRADRCDAGELAFLHVQQKGGAAERIGRFIGVLFFPVLALFIAGGLDLFLMTEQDGLKSIFLFWGICGLLLVSIVTLARIVSRRIEQPYTAVLTAGAVWLLLVFGLDFIWGVCLMFQPPDWIPFLGLTLNPVDLYRLTIYRVIPQLGPAVQHRIPSFAWLMSGWIIWLVILPGIHFMFDVLSSRHSSTI